MFGKQGLRGLCASAFRPTASDLLIRGDKTTDISPKNHWRIACLCILLCCHTVDLQNSWTHSRRKKKPSWPSAMFSKKGECSKDKPRERPGGEFKERRPTGARPMIGNIKKKQQRIELLK